MPVEIVCADALEWLRGNRGRGAIVTSPPDAEEIGADVEHWSTWFGKALRGCFDAADGAPVVLYVTDRLAYGMRASKAQIALEAAHEAGEPLVWHKIALRRGVGKIDLRRPSFTHMLAFGHVTAGQATPDVIERGDMLYPNATGLVAARLMVEFAMRHSRCIVDPFCGQGTIPAVAAALGADAIGVDIDPDQCEKARALRLRDKKGPLVLAAGQGSQEKGSG